MKGKIIAITGGPRTGKSTLVRLLSERLNAKAFFEGEEKDFPQRIIDDIKRGENMLELILWFRNKYVADYLKGIEIKNSGGIAILDVFWATNDVYVDGWVVDEFERGVLKKFAEIDYKLLRWPDLVLALFSNKNKIKEFSFSGGRKFELNEDFLQKQVDLNNTHEEYFRKIRMPNIEFIDRSNLDFNDDKEINKIVSFVKKFLKTED
jgi:deoxyadenosine/deoxycytidine kinase